jgi:hypothetical protein
MLGKIRIVHAGGYDPRHGRTIDPTLELSSSLAMTSLALPLPPTSEELADHILSRVQSALTQWCHDRDLPVLQLDTLPDLHAAVVAVLVPAMTSPASPLPPTSPDGAGASCGPPAPSGRALCRVCGSGQLTQSDTSDHPGVVRCNACGLMQTA